jgi:hypothetical protein
MEAKGMDARRARTRGIVEGYPYKANLYRLTLDPMPAELYLVRAQAGRRHREEIHFSPVAGSTVVKPLVRYMRRALQRTIMSALTSCGYKIGGRKRDLIVDAATNHLPARGYLGIYSAYRVRVLYFSGAYYLCINHHLVERVTTSLASILSSGVRLQLAPSQRVFVKRGGQWDEGRLIASGADTARLALAAGGEEITVPSTTVAPDLSRPQIARLAPALGITAHDLERTMKRLSFLTVADAPRARIDACTEFAGRIAQAICTIDAGNVSITVNAIPATLRPPTFDFRLGLQEPLVVFDRADRSKRARDIRQGLVSFGAYDKPSSEVRLVVLTTHNRVTEMEALVRRMNDGSSRYPGAIKVFNVSFATRGTIACAAVDEYEEALREFLHSGARRDTDVALVYLPRGDNGTDPRRPYSRVKGLLAREGLVSQMVDERTVRDPEWSDLNLALNVYAKAGYVPWVLDEAMPNVDLFIGLSSSSIVRRGRVERMMGYANVFDAYGRWRFFQGDNAAFAFEDRLQHYGDVVKNSLAAYRAENGGPLRSVHIHLTKAFSEEERRVLMQVVHSVVPEATVTFVWVNPYHPLRLYGFDADDAQISRATYLCDGAARLYITTTGTNAFNQRGIGTPVPLQLTIWPDHGSTRCCTMSRSTCSR